LNYRPAADGVYRLVPGLATPSREMDRTRRRSLRVAVDVGGVRAARVGFAGWGTLPRAGEAV